jgi:hypothetical protein
MSVIVRGTEGISFPDSVLQPVAAAVTVADLAALQARLNAYDEAHKTRFDTRRITPGQWVFSNNDLTATRIGSDGWQTACSYPSGFYDRIYAEVKLDNLVNQGWTMLGFGTPWGVALAAYAGNNVWGVSYMPNGTWYYNGSATGGLPTIDSGETMAMAIDGSVGAWWFRNVSRNSYWEHPSYDPALPGQPPHYGYPGARSPCCIIVANYNGAGGTSFTINTDGPFLGQVPTGYRRWRGRAI